MWWFWGQEAYLITVNFGTPPHYLALQKYTKKCVNSQQNIQNRPTFRVRCAKGALAKKSTQPLVVAVVTNISYVKRLHKPKLVKVNRVRVDLLVDIRF